MGLWDSKDSKDAAERHRQERIKASDKALKDMRDQKKKAAKHLSFGNSSRTETAPGFFGLGSRAAKDMKQENAKSGYYGFFGAKHVTAKGKKAQELAKKKKR
jgi:hypothetical protein